MSGWSGGSLNGACCNCCNHFGDERHTSNLAPLPPPLSLSPQHAFITPAGRRYARTGGPDVRPSQAVSLFVVERGMPGFSLGQRLKDK